MEFGASLNHVSSDGTNCGDNGKLSSSLDDHILTDICCIINVSECVYKVEMQHGVLRRRLLMMRGSQ